MHSHNYCGLTTLEQRHIHHYAGVTSVDENMPRHRHRMEGYTTYDDEHAHYYALETGPAIYLPFGGHYHYFRGRVQYVRGHSHTIFGITSAD